MSQTLTPRERFIAALERRPLTGRVPHFELAFFLTMEAFGRVCGGQRGYWQWDQMSKSEQTLHIRDMADLHIQVARTYEWSAIFPPLPRPWGQDAPGLRIALLEEIRNQSGMEFYTMLHGDATYAVPSGEHMMDFVGRIADDPQGVKDEARRKVDAALAAAERYKAAGVLDGFALCDDYCYNSGPFLSPAMFDEFITPFMTDLIRGYREMGFYVIKHTDGNIMPILDSLVSANPHALHSIDPQGDVDLAEVKRLVGEKVCLIGNVNCGLLDTGTEEEVVESVRYALKHGMPGYGYIFSTSNCIYTGMDLKRYELMLKIWREEGNYTE